MVSPALFLVAAVGVLIGVVAALVYRVRAEVKSFRVLYAENQRLHLLLTERELSIVGLEVENERLLNTLDAAGLVHKFKRREPSPYDWPISDDLLQRLINGDNGEAS
jgi:uncharacterized membrane protein YccC